MALLYGGGGFDQSHTPSAPPDTKGGNDSPIVPQVTPHDAPPACGLEDFIGMMFNFRASDMEKAAAALLSPAATTELRGAIRTYLIVWTTADRKDLDGIYFAGRRIGRVTYQNGVEPIGDLLVPILGGELSLDNDVVGVFTRGSRDGCDRSAGGSDRAASYFSK